MSVRLKEVTKEIAVHREEIIKKLVQFSLTDLLLFWGNEKDLIIRQEKEWAPLLVWAQEELNTKFTVTHNLDVPDDNKTSGYRLKYFLEQMTDKELAAFYVAALNMRSVLLASALVKGRINAEQAFQAAFLEELWQAENWGTDEEAEKKRQDMKNELQEVENFLKS